MTTTRLGLVPPRLALAAAVVAMLSAPALAETVHARLDGYQEVPPVSTAGEGRFVARIDRRDGTITYELSYDGLEGAVTQAHIHFGPPAVAGGISAFLCTNLGNGPAGVPACPESGTVSGTIDAADVIGPVPQGIGPGELDELVAAIREGAAYVNVHSSLAPAGEIRGEIR